MSNKKKIIALSDHALSTSGVGTQSRHLFNGLIEKGEWSIRQFGAALKHADYRTVVVNDDLIIKPIISECNFCCEVIDVRYRGIKVQCCK